MKKLHLANVSGRFIFLSDNEDYHTLKANALDILIECDGFCLSSDIREINSLDAVPLDLREKVFINYSSNVIDDEEDPLTSLTPEQYFNNSRILDFLKEKLSEEDFEIAKELL